MWKKLFRKEKPKQNPLELFLTGLEEERLKTHELTVSFILADEMILKNIAEYDQISKIRRKFHEQIGMSKQGRPWFQETFLPYVNHLKKMSNWETQLPRLDVFLSLYWYFCEQYPSFIAPIQEEFETLLDPRIRRYYEKVFNVDIYTGKIYDEETEMNNAWKQHFYKASFAFQDGKGNIDISMQEWRKFIAEFHETLASRPRLIYDFAKEIVEYQKLFYFFSYVVRMERVNQLKSVLLGNKDGTMDKLIYKVINAVYAVDEERGQLLRKLYI